MSLADDLKTQVEATFAGKWDSRDGRVVPEPEDITLGNDAVAFDRATVLYTDLSGSTSMVDTMKWWFAAEVYKTFLHCAATLIRNNGGVITSYDGDRVMGVFIGDTQSTSAVKCGLKINYAVLKIINPAIKAQYSSTDFKVKQVTGIDTSSIVAARTGVRGGNDIVWVGRAANYAAKLTDLDLQPRTWITEAVFDKMSADAKTSNGNSMWKKYKWSQKDEIPIYGSTWHWTV